MTYKKAQDVLPNHLIEEVQKYLDGGLLYIPKKTQRRKWGSANGTQVALAKRNQEIKSLFSQGYGFEALSKQFCLSEDSIRKIVKSARLGTAVNDLSLRKNNYK